MVFLRLFINYALGHYMVIPPLVEIYLSALIIVPIVYVNFFEFTLRLVTLKQNNGRIKLLIEKTFLIYLPRSSNELKSIL